MKPKARKKIIDALSGMDINGDSGSKRIFSEAESKRIMSKYAKSNSNVAKRFFDREELFINSDITKYEPLLLEDNEIHKEYIPELLKRVATIG